MSALAFLLAAQISVSHGHAVRPPPRAHHAQAAFGRGLRYLGGIALVPEAPAALEEAPAPAPQPVARPVETSAYFAPPAPAPVAAAAPTHRRGTQAKIIYLRPVHARRTPRIVNGAG